MKIIAESFGKNASRTVIARQVNEKWVDRIVCALAEDCHGKFYFAAAEDDVVIPDFLSKLNKHEMISFVKAFNAAPPSLPKGEIHQAYPRPEMPKKKRSKK